MKTIGLIGGMSWESSAHYYRILNEAVRERRGGSHSARSLMLSLDFAEIDRLQHDGAWSALEDQIVSAARALERGGADMVLICTNTMHRVADAVAAAIDVPLLHIADPVAAAAQAAGQRTLGLIGTAFTMEGDFLKGRLARDGLSVIVPEADDRATVHAIIYDELVQGRIEEGSRAALRGVIARLVAAGAEAVVLGCTELMLLVAAEDSAVPLHDTTRLHALAAVDLALGDVRLPEPSHGTDEEGEIALFEEDVSADSDQWVHIRPKDQDG